MHYAMFLALSLPPFGKTCLLAALKRLNQRVPTFNTHNRYTRTFQQCQRVFILRPIFERCGIQAYYSHLHSATLHVTYSFMPVPRIRRSNDNSYRISSKVEGIHGQGLFNTSTLHSCYHRQEFKNTFNLPITAIK